jgi:hypothetical protein
MLAVIFVTFLNYGVFKSNKLLMIPDLLRELVKERHESLFLAPFPFLILVYHQFADNVTHLVLVRCPLVFDMLAVNL